MDSVRDCYQCLNTHWLVIVLTGMYVHIRQICVIGFCVNELELPPFESSYASLLFIFSMLCLLAEYNLWPVTLKEPPIHLLYIYEMLVATLATNLTTHVIWIPLMHDIYCLTQEASKWITYMNTMLELGRYSFLIEVAYFMQQEIASTLMAYCVSFFSFLWMLDATESVGAVVEFWSDQ